ncbi:hypothetical protein NPIL_224611 [Nephila pilipes]|uniref:Uncharacterized protein n=1 Tax=Nephila pilipes TaxID=299642 RepID=A0A8X6N2N6_NEPPI|nr:hypothetical protein NPIL_224611 [Nephila pilipes]
MLLAIFFCLALKHRFKMRGYSQIYNKMDLLQFRREICQTYFSKYSKRPYNSLAAGKLKKLFKTVPEDVQYDGKYNLIVVNVKQMRCSYWGKKSTRK